MNKGNCVNFAPFLISFLPLHYQQKCKKKNVKEKFPIFDKICQIPKEGNLFLLTQSMERVALVRNLKKEYLHAQEEVKRIQSVPLVIGQFLEAIDEHTGIVGKLRNYLRSFICTFCCDYFIPVCHTLYKSVPSSFNQFKIRKCISFTKKLSTFLIFLSVLIVIYCNLVTPLTIFYRYSIKKFAKYIYNGDVFFHRLNDWQQLLRPHPVHLGPGAAEAVGQRGPAQAQQRPGRRPAARGGLLHFDAWRR